MKTYRTRISVRLILIVSVSWFLPIAFVPSEEMLHVTAITIPIFLMILLCFYGIKYVIDGKTLKVYSFWGIHQDIDITTITKMEKSSCILSAPAASLKRLAIYYGKFDVVYISPRNQEDFICEINKISPVMYEG